MPKELEDLRRHSNVLNTGKYIGYTEKNKGFPTLYFEKGHITQKHDSEDCIGWNPSYKKNVILRNINDKGVSAFNGCFDENKMNLRKFYNFLLKLKAYQFDPDKGEKGRLLSYTEDATFTHLSRSFLVKMESKSCCYGEEYANEVLKNTTLSKVSKVRGENTIKGRNRRRCNIM